MLSDLVFPALTPYEQVGLFANMEGRYLKISKAIKKVHVSSQTYIKFLWHFVKVCNTSLWLFRGFFFGLANFYLSSRVTKRMIPSIFSYFLARSFFYLPNMKSKLNTLPNIIAEAVEDDMYVKSRLYSTSFSSYHRFYYSYDIFSSNSFNCLLAYKRFRKLFINYTVGVH
jgi:hypothetical protein